MSLSIAILGTALLFGGMTLYSFVFAAFLFSALPAQTAGTVLRRAFPWFYVFVIATATLSALFWWRHDMLSAVVLAAVAITTLPARQSLMPAVTFRHKSASDFRHIEASRRVSDGHRSGVDFAVI